MFMTFRVTTLTVALLATTALAANAETLRWARAGDSLTLDPHAQNEGPTHTLAHQMMEPLVMRDMTGQMVPALATEWGPKADDPNVWVFKLREGVTFHDGATFDSEDVVFSLERAQTPDSNMKELLASVVAVRATGPYEVEIETNGPNPIMPSNLTNTFIMDKGWTEANNAVKVQDVEGGEDTFSAKNTNGTGPYKLVSREPDVRTVLEINENYWGKDEFPLEVTRIEYTPIQNAATRIAALLSGEVDPAGVAMPPFVNGWTAALDEVPANDMAMAKSLMAEAGYGDGFSITLHCPNDRYINDEAICQAAVGMMAQIGIDVNLDAKPKAQHFPQINNLETDFYMLGWGVPTYDSEYIFNFLVHTKGDKYGSWNGTRYSDPELDAKIVALASETDLDARNASIAEIWAQVQEDMLYLPIHHQVLNWGMTDRVETIVDPEDQVKFKYFTFN
ncbi:UNVERIFIED_CONTAM: hypothetical protein GTU68_022160 [Idotea baltica]|nr:hypothetical protein [Idotea baltica]